MPRHPSAAAAVPSRCHALVVDGEAGTIEAYSGIDASNQEVKNIQTDALGRRIVVEYELDGDNDQAGIAWGEAM